MDVFSQGGYNDRRPYAAGRFYSDDKATLIKDVATLFDNCTKVDAPGEAVAIVVPHAGYVFSGEIAASAFRTTPSKGKYRNIFIIGSSHVAAFNGASVYSIGDYLTPMGRAVVNKEITNKLISASPLFRFPASFHDNDHNIEVQIPLIQHYYEDSPTIVPIIIGTDNRAIIKELALVLKEWFTPDNLFVISSDFSHYPTYDEANKVDALTANAFLSGDPNLFVSVIADNSRRGVKNLATSMCGWTSGLLLLELIAGDNSLSMIKVDYCNSGDSPYGEKDEVVGYNAIGVYADVTVKDDNETGLSFSKEDKSLLFRIARESIEATLAGREVEPIKEDQVPPTLKNNYGAFVTLKIGDDLRGCIGQFVSNDPLFEAVQQSAVASAFEDPRFESLTEAEYKKVSIEITVIGPMKRINDIGEISLGMHGIYIKKGSRAGTMLPQVAIENGWDVEEFLSYTSKYKAGIGSDGWKTAEIYVYEGLVLDE